ncbi:MAG: hypothetical protein JWP97_5487 [Labilithrix sp.]|nr:hypothetical protein [Labilithrix sp.]
MRTEVIVGLAVVAAGLVAGCSADGATSDDEPVASVEQASTFHSDDDADDDGHGPFGVLIGRELFFNEFPGVQGNGRACATCHVKEDGFQLTPAHVQARWDKLQAARKHHPNADDPLFRSIDANDFANDFSNLKRGLVRVVLKLPTDSAGNKLIWPLDDPGATTVDVFRAVPTINNVAFTAPYQADGRFATLQIQAQSALDNHAEAKRKAPSFFLDDVSAFEKTQFSSHRARRLSDALASGGPLPSTEPTDLTPLEQQGKALFAVDCATCHGGPRGTQPLPQLAALQDIMVSKPLPPFAEDLPFPPSPPLRVRLWAVRIPGAPAPAIRPSTDPGKALISGDMADFAQFDVPTLFGVGKTAPYFHDNSAPDLTTVMKHYQQLFTALRRVIPPEVPFPSRPPEIADEDIAPLVAYTRRL